MKHLARVTPSRTTPTRKNDHDGEPSPPRKKLRITIKRPLPVRRDNGLQATVHDCGSTNRSQQLKFQAQDNVNRRKTIHDLFDVKEMIGEGGFGKVYLAVRRCDQQVVALKAIPINDRGFFSSSFESNEECLRREVSALMALSDPGHPHVCRLYDLPVRDNTHSYFAMEYIGGGELFQHLVSKGPFSERDAAKFLRQFADALHYIHSKGYVHSDLKPENLMMGSWEKEEPRLKVVDFGFSIPDQESIKLASYGTVAYLPPECLVKGHSGQGEPWHPNAAGDMFAAGVIVYTVLTGTHPFDRTNQASNTAIANAIIESLTATTEQRLDSINSPRSAVRGKKTTGYLDTRVFDNRTDGLSSSSISLMRGLLHPDPKQRMTSSQFSNHPWILGQTATTHCLSSSHHSKLKSFWQRRFRAAILQKFWGSASQRRGHGRRRRSLTHKESELMFRSMDLNGDGRVSLEELKRSMTDDTSLSSLPSPTSSSKKMKQYMLDDIFSSVDEDGSGGIDLEEFQRTMSQKFDATDINENIRYKNEQVRGCILQKFGDTGTHAKVGGENDGRNPISRESLRIIFDIMDLNKDGFLQLSEAIAVLRETPQLDEDMISTWVSDLLLVVVVEKDYQKYTSCFTTTSIAPWARRN